MPPAHLAYHLSNRGSKYNQLTQIPEPKGLPQGVWDRAVRQKEL